MRRTFSLAALGDIDRNDCCITTSFYIGLTLVFSGDQKSEAVGRPVLERLVRAQLKCCFVLIKKQYNYSQFFSDQFCKISPRIGSPGSVFATSVPFSTTICPFTKTCINPFEGRLLDPDS